MYLFQQKCHTNTDITMTTGLKVKRYKLQLPLICIYRIIDEC